MAQGTLAGVVEFVMSCGMQWTDKHYYVHPPLKKGEAESTGLSSSRRQATESFFALVLLVTPPRLRAVPQRHSPRKNNFTSWPPGEILGLTPLTFYFVLLYLASLFLVDSIAAQQTWQRPKPQLLPPASDAALP